MSQKKVGEKKPKASKAGRGFLPSAQIRGVMRDPRTGRMVQISARVLG